jgi:hypothetical protein
LTMASNSASPARTQHLPHKEISEIVSATGTRETLVTLTLPLRNLELTSVAATNQKVCLPEFDGKYMATLRPAQLAFGRWLTPTGHRVRNLEAARHGQAPDLDSRVNSLVLSIKDYLKY